MLRFITPLTIAPAITMIGLSLITSAANLASQDWAVSMATVILMAAFSQYMVRMKVPVPAFSRKDGLALSKVPIFNLFPVGRTYQ